MTKIKIAAVLTLIAIPSLVFGAGVPPSNVEGVHVSNANGIVTVTWQPAKDDKSIAFYRLYYSRASILDNGGDYDDFERTRGAETAYSFTKPPINGGTLYVGVLAVDTEGNESEGFETEGSIVLGANTPTSEPTKPVQQENVVAPTPENTATTTPMNTTVTPMTYTAVVATSNTGILLSFSKELDMGNKPEPRFFLVKDGSGNALSIMRTDAGGANVLLTTAPQTPGKIYTVSVLTSLRAKDGSELPSSTPAVQFVGFGTIAVTTPVATQQPQVPVAPAQQMYIKNPVIAAQTVQSPLSVRLVPMKQKNGLFTILAQWRGGTNAGVGYSVSVSYDGTHFNAPIDVSANQSSMQFENVKPGSGFVVRVIERGTGGQIQSGNSASLELPKTGVGLLGIAGAAGALAARRRTRRRKSC